MTKYTAGIVDLHTYCFGSPNPSNHYEMRARSSLDFEKMFVPVTGLVCTGKKECPAEIPYTINVKSCVLMNDGNDMLSIALEVFKLLTSSAECSRVLQ